MHRLLRPSKLVIGTSKTQAIFSQVGKDWVNLGNEGVAVKRDGSDRCGSQSAKWFPHNIAFIGDCVQYSLHEFKRLLVEVSGRRARWFMDAGSRSA
jgi:hypothetical protein